MLLGKDLSPRSELGGKKGKKTRKKLRDLVPGPTSLAGTASLKLWRVVHAQTFQGVDRAAPGISM